MNEYINSATSVVMLYLIISTNFLPELFGCSTRKLLSSFLVKQICGFFILFFFITNVDNKNPLARQMFITLLIYLWFFLTTKSDAYMTFITLFLLMVIFIMEKYKEEQKANKDDLNSIEYINNIQYLLLILSIISTLIGVYLYINKKKTTFPKSFSYRKFIFSASKCRKFND